MLRTPASLSGYPTSTWTGLGDPTLAQGQIFRVTDVGVSGVGILVMSDGTRWLPLGPQVLARNAVAATVTGTTNETTLATITVPGGLLGLRGSLRYTLLGSATNNANTKTVRVKIGATAFTFIAQSAYAAQQAFGEIRNRSAANSQIGTSQTSGGFGSSTTTAVTGALDTTVDQSLTITGQLGVGTDSYTLDGYTVEVLP